MTFLKIIAWLSAGAIMVLSGFFGYELISRLDSSAHGHGHPANLDASPATTVKTITPKLDETFVRSISSPAYVEAYYKADLFAHIAGPVRYIEKNIGDPVQAGELLVEIDVPDLEQEIAQKEALIGQAEADCDAAKAHLQTLTEALETAKLLVPEREAHLDEMIARRDLRKIEWERFQQLEKRQVVLLDVVEEKFRDYRVSMAACKTAELSMATARSEFHGAEAKLAEARADLKVKESRITVAQKDKERVRAQANFAKIRAPFSGVITKRNIDPGDFVQNATTARTQPMLTVMSTDLVTIATMVPERSARYVVDGQDAFISIEVKDKKIKNLVGKVKRHSPTLDPEKGRTMRLEVDLYNPPLYGYKKSLREGILSFLAPLGATSPAGATGLFACGQQIWNRPGLLQPGMYGTMKVVLERYTKPYLIPSSAVFNYQGKTCILLVKDRVAHRVPVTIQLEDGVRAKVAVIDREARPDSSDEDVTHELSAQDEVIVCGQGEITDGQEVRTVGTPW